MKIRDAVSAPLPVGEFDLITERIADGTVVSRSTSLRGLVKLGDEGERLNRLQEGRMSPGLELCRNCNSYILPSETSCPHCGADVQSAARRHDEDVRRRRAVKTEMERILSELAAAPAG